MKIQKSNASSQQGTVLVVTLVLCALLGLLIGSYLSMIKTQANAVARSQAWNQAVVVAEAGVEEAMAHLNSGVSTNNLATNSWSDLGNGNYGKTNVLGTSYSSVTIKISTNAFPVIVSTSYVPAPLGGPTLSRTVQVATKTKLGSGGGGAIIVSGTINLSGSGITVDSFDSSNTNYSTGGQYDPNKRLANGDIFTTSSASNAIYVGDALVYGTVHTAPGGVVGYDTGQHPTYSVGDSNYVGSGTVGFEPGHVLADTTTTLSDVQLPSLSWLPAINGAKYKVNGVMYDYDIETGGPLIITGDLSTSVYVNAPGVVLYVTGNVNIGSGGAIYIAPGADLTMYVAGSTTTLGGQGVVNTTGLARDFQYYGLPTNTSVGLQGNAGLTGQIDAPEAYVTLGGGGSSNGTTNDFTGQILANTFKMNGHFKVHYDQALGQAPAPSGYTATFWAEL